MTRKDFELIARTIAKVPDKSTRAFLILEFADELRATNPRFDFARFSARVHTLAAIDYPHQEG